MCIDAMSIISAVSAEHIKPPAEKTLLCHLLWLQEITRNGLMRDLKWLDTRDMTGDGHTKGSIPRLALWQLAAGQLYQLYPPKSAAIKSAPGTLIGTHFFCVALPAMPPPGKCPSAAGFNPFGQLLDDDDVQVTTT